MTVHVSWWSNESESAVQCLLNGDFHDQRSGPNKHKSPDSVRGGGGTPYIRMIGMIVVFFSG